MDQGWLLVCLTSITTILGCCVIYVDLIYQTLFRRLSKSRPFNIQKNTTFLICSLSLSSGCLLFTSLYKLLPKSHNYLKKASLMKSNRHTMEASLILFFFSGIVLCSMLNIIIHFFTSESIVHCVHEQHEHSHNSEDENSEINSLNNSQYSHHSESEQIVMPTLNSHSHSHIQSNDYYHSHSQPHSHSHSDTSNFQPAPKIGSLSSSKAAASPTEHTPLLQGVPSSKKLSLVDMSLKALKGTLIEGECLGSIEHCQADIIAQHKLHGKRSKELHFCTLPSEENILFFNKETKELLTKKSEICLRYPELEVISPLMDDDNAINRLPRLSDNSQSSKDNSNNTNLEEVSKSNLSVTKPFNEGHLRHSDHETHSHIHHHDIETSSDAEAMEHHHHHHIQTPLSRLLSIGVQTTLAITLHKFPEGFIMYSTSQADPELGITIFLSLFIHNFVEGFTMTLPIYIALDSRLKALAISGTLGASAQPVGALIGWYFFGGNLDLTLDRHLILIGGLIALTSGFLTFIALQMFASSIGFGGRQETVLTWAFIGVFLIGLSDILIG